MRKSDRQEEDEDDDWASLEPYRQCCHEFCQTSILRAATADDGKGLFNTKSANDDFRPLMSPQS
jgi:hypothetical protein